jgi:glutamate dehydrogenase (NAD(P)+)
MIRPYCPLQYIAATDIGTTELDMAIFAHEIGDMRACTGKPQELGGIPHELGTTGYGVAVALDSAMEALEKTQASSTRSAILDKDLQRFLFKVLAMSGLLPQSSCI